MNRKRCFLEFSGIANNIIPVAKNAAEVCPLGNAWKCLSTSPSMFLISAPNFSIGRGKFKITFIDVATGEIKQSELSEGQTADFGQLGPHQIEALVPNSIIFEVGTADYIEDRFRLAPGDTQTSAPQSNHSS